MMKRKLLKCLSEGRKIKISVTSDMIDWKTSQTVKIHFDDCDATLFYDDVYPHWCIDENFKVNIVDILADAYVNVISYDEKKDVFELDHSSFFVKEEEKIKVGNIYSATIMGCNQFCAFCRLQDGNLVRVDKANMVPRNITDVRKIYIRGDKVKLVISRIYDYNEVTKYVGSFIVPGRKFTGKVGQYVRARVEAKKFNEDNKVFAVVLDCGEEREGELYLNDDKNPSEGDIVIVKIKRIVGNKIKLRFQD